MNTTLDERRLDVVIFLAGFTFLVYEVAWNRLLALVLGATVAASTLVLAAFMAGLGAGAYFWGRRAAGRGTPRRAARPAARRRRRRQRPRLRALHARGSRACRATRWSSP